MVLSTYQALGHQTGHVLFQGTASYGEKDIWWGETGASLPTSFLQRFQKQHHIAGCPVTPKCECRGAVTPKRECRGEIQSWPSASQLHYANGVQRGCMSCLRPPWAWALVSNLPPASPLPLPGLGDFSSCFWTESPSPLKFCSYSPSFSLCHCVSLR